MRHNIGHSIVWAPSILYFKGIGMRNLQYEIRICPKSHNIVTITVYVWTVVRILKKETLLVTSVKNKLFI